MDYQHILVRKYNLKYIYQELNAYNMVLYLDNHYCYSKMRIFSNKLISLE